MGSEITTRTIQVEQHQYDGGNENGWHSCATGDVDRIAGLATITAASTEALIRNNFGRV
jgi:hypothetical protein